MAKNSANRKPAPEPEKLELTESVLCDDLECCPRCGFKIENIVWGKTDCPNCGLHFECC